MNLASERDPLQTAVGIASELKMIFSLRGTRQFKRSFIKVPGTATCRDVNRLRKNIFAAMIMTRSAGGCNGKNKK